MFQLLYRSLITKLSTPPFFKFQHLKKHLLYLLNYCRVQQRVYQDWSRFLCLSLFVSLSVSFFGG